MKIKTFVFNTLYENTYVVYDESKEAFIIDPGCYETYEQKELAKFIEEEELIPVAILNTHCHIDHVLGNSWVKHQYHIPVWIPQLETEVLSTMKVMAPGWGITNYQSIEHDRLLSEGEILELKHTKLKCILAPGHSVGHFMFYCKEYDALFAGDVIFRESIGRTDIPGGNYTDLENSIKTKVYKLPPHTVIYPGHGETTTVGHEMVHNPFIKNP